MGKCLLQDVGVGGYRVHDLVLDFVKIKIKADGEMVKKATTLQAHFLGRLDVLKGYESPEHGAGNQGLFVLDALWRSAEQLSGDPKLEVVSYTTSLGELESCEATTDVANSYASVGFLFNIQVRRFFCLGIPRCCFRARCVALYNVTACTRCGFPPTRCCQQFVFDMFDDKLSCNSTL